MSKNEETLKVKAGGIIIVSLILFLFMIFAAGNLVRYFSEQKQYKMYVESAKGLAVNHPVKYSGVLAGEVSDIHIDTKGPMGRNVVIVMLIDGKYKIKSDSVAMIQPEGIMGNYSVNIIPGSKGEILQDGGLLEGRTSTLLGSLTGGDIDFSVVTKKLNHTIDTIDKTVQNNQKKINAIVDNLESFSKALVKTDMMTKVSKAADSMRIFTDNNNEKLASSLVSIDNGMKAFSMALERNNETLHSSLVSLNNLSSLLGNTIKKNDENLTLAIKNIGESSRFIGEVVNDNKQEIKDSLVNLTSAVNSMESFMDKANNIIDDNRRHLYKSVYNLNVLSANLKIASENIKANPSVLLFGEKGAESLSLERKEMEETYLEMGIVGRYGKEKQ